MGINWNELWGKATDAADQALKDVVKTGVPAIQASLEQWGLDVLQKQHEETTKKLNDNVAEVLNRPTEDGSFGYYMQNTIKSPIMQQYGPMILMGVAGLVVVGMVIRK